MTIFEDFDLLKLANEGSIDAQIKLATLSFEKNRHSLIAFEWFNRAATSGDAHGLYMAGYMYAYGLSKTANFEKAQEYFERAVSLGYGPAFIELALMYQRGQNVHKPEGLDDLDNTDLARQYYEMAWELHNLDEARLLIRNLDEPRKEEAPEESAPAPVPEDFVPQVFQLPEDIKFWADVPPEERHTGASIHEADIIADPFEKLESLIGLEKVKAQIYAIEKRIRFDAMRAEHNLTSPAHSHHFVFTGNPGTGKNEVARILGALFKKMGLLETGHVVETDRSTLVGQYIGETAQKTKDVINKAMGGVLFIDEAYSLFDDLRGDYGAETVATLLKVMEDKRSDFIVVMAGYKDEMNNLINSNPGLKSRINHTLHFDDYSAEELHAICHLFIGEGQFTFEETADEALYKLMEKAAKTLNKRFGNARFARNVIEKTLEKMATRVINNDLRTEDDLKIIRFMDIPSLEEMTGAKERPGSSDVLPFKKPPKKP